MANNKKCKALTISRTGYQTFLFRTLPFLALFLSSERKNYKENPRLKPILLSKLFQNHIKFVKKKFTLF